MFYRKPIYTEGVIANRDVITNPDEYTMQQYLKKTINVFPTSGGSFRFYLSGVEPTWMIGLQYTGTKWVARAIYYSEVSQITTT